MTAPPAAPSAWHALRERLPPLSILGPFVALLITCIFFSFESSRFLTGQNFSLIAQQVAVVGVIAIGQTSIILTGGIDLACGSIMGLGSMVIAKFAVELGISPPLAIGCGLLVTALFGWLNGMLVTFIRLPPFIATLGTLNIAFALAQIYSGAQTVSDLPDPLVFFGETFQIGSTAVSYGTVLMLFLYLVFWLVLRETAVGRHIYAVGNHPEAARLMGISTRRILIGVYTVAGLLYGVAALLTVARTGVGDPQAGQTENLDSITAVVLGGTSLFGGRGVITGSLIGALIVGVFRNGLTLMGIPSVYQVLVTGILIILAVATDRLTQRGT